MSKKDAPLKQDVEELLEKAIVEEATEAVWKSFETALSKMDESSIALLKSHFQGTSDRELSSQRGIEEREICKMVKHSKKELIELIRREKTTKH